MQIVGSVIYQGQKIDLVASPKQWADLQWIGGKFAVNQRLISDFKQIEPAFNKFCEDSLRKIIDRQIAKLRTKQITIDLEYSDSQKTFKKATKVSVDSYLKLLNFEPKIEYKIGIYDKEWGINELKAGAKKFTLYFNLNLIKFDSGSHVEYVVAHELAHVFFRDHGVGFNDALAKLYPRKAESEYFFNWRIGLLSAQAQDQTVFYFIIFGLGSALGFYWIYTQFGLWWQNLFDSAAPNNPKFY